MLKYLNFLKDLIYDNNNELLIGEIKITEFQKNFYIYNKNDAFEYLIKNKDNIYYNYIETYKLALKDNQKFYRPIKSSNDLSNDWLIKLKDLASLYNAINIFYPSSIAIYKNYLENNLHIVSFEESTLRQRGSYKKLFNLSDKNLNTLVNQICEQKCLKLKLWDKTNKNSKSNIQSNQNNKIPLLCCEVCNYFMTKAI